MDKKNKLAFLSMPAPASYVAGLGRGASGFTTRSDIGPAREGPSEEVIAEARARRGEEDVDPEQFQDPDNEYGLFAGTTYEADDEEADRIWEGVDEAMDKRRRAKREAREQEELARHRAERPKIQQQFADLKRGLAELTEEEWNIPEVGNLTRRKRRRENERSYVVPDSVLVGDRAKGEYESSLDPTQQATGGFETPAGATLDSGTMTNFVEIGQARDKILSLKLDQVSNPSSSISGTSTSIDPKGYLTSLDTLSSTHKSSSEIGDIKRARMLFDSLVKSNPKHAPGWIAAACLEEHAGRLVKARKIIREGCENCKTSEDVWLEAARLHSNEDAKVILANAVQHVGQSVKIWLAAADLEHDVKAKKRVLRKALEHIPNSVRLWKETVNLESSASDARILLARAVEVIPSSVELWLALARLETPDKAKAVLNKARKAVPTSHEIWIAAGRLLEQEALRVEEDEEEAKVKKEEGEVKIKKEEDGMDVDQIPDSAPTTTPAPKPKEKPKEKKYKKSPEQRQKELEAVDKTIELAVRELRKHQVLLTREQWLKEAEKCEEDGSLRTCEAIVKATVGMVGEDEDDDERLDLWMADAESCEARGKVGTARAILAYALRVYPDRRRLWRQAVDLEKAHGTRESLDAILSRAVQHCPQAEVLWLMAAKEKWNAGDVDGAREILDRAFVANKESEAIWLAAVKLEAENGELGAARELLVRARSVADTERIWMKSAVFERRQNQLDTALETINTALQKFPKSPKSYLIQSQIYLLKNNIPAARGSLSAGLKACPRDARLWIAASRLEEVDGKSIKARAVLEKARLVFADKKVVVESRRRRKVGLDGEEEEDEDESGAKGGNSAEWVWAESVLVEERAATASSVREKGKLTPLSFALNLSSLPPISTPQAKSMLARALQDQPSSGLLWSLAIFSEARPQRKSKSVDALKKTGDDKNVVCAVARLFWSERKVEKAREWFVRVRRAGGGESWGDGWAWGLVFERRFGSEEHRATLRAACAAAEPRYGPVWQAVAKDDRNVGKSVEEVLEMVADVLEGGLGGVGGM
ncbi:pre-mRNA splicing factor prp1 [Coprinopsis cinerea okayama7|uniref:Pre-mRNA splicing factor prp1 n=1 Tax=Coprinopsis cinerea (strain Okayama-7 / 130 / ATCC MYA-4618 / FGSC 9003) TaxID=240176 RepID=A8NPR1_COPC7|nr:pre-mRNA splicing factor prp1 [Coprinopsis cinerea okayama7\|eukprot:XP_001835379.2 pre-mRNA splicing factor prp1 [Coprinopsis cinerea okayama7\